jgi:type VI secretion system protein ImpA
MASLDLDALLREISPQAPSGDNLEDDTAFQTALAKAEIKPAKQIGKEGEPGSYSKPEQLPNWREVREDLLKLMRTTRDLRLLVEMARASLNLDGVEGLAESLELLRRSLETYWDTLHPRPDADDPEDYGQRVRLIEELGDKDSVLRFLQAAPLVQCKAFGRFSLRDIHMASGKSPVPAGAEATDLSTIKAAFIDVAKTSPDLLLKTQAALKASLDSAAQIERLVAAKTGEAPSLQPLRDKLKESLYAMDEQLAQCGLGAETPAELETPATDYPAGLPAPQRSAQAESFRPAGAINSREDVIRALDLICEYYAKHEPSSPVPLLARRAKQLAGKNFMEIIEDLAPDGLNQIRLIKGNDPDGDGQN